ncbi:lipopolysaccharide biosynthesis protein [Photobacterium phosphoreum]|uniref:lipopolysaccharide biosynthesis protein n=1 Tax=Photobacterium phosphoreum TaxID=659 RepID=UPI001E55A66C|nr:oligosaccharide flippase family protein [Photobacterium phosphoreum]MCD9521049.1 oligosaccharide flippase family protein [Photobacterium phosphoreum]
MYLFKNLKNRHHNLYFILGSALCGAISIITIPSLTWIYSVKTIGVYAIFVAAVGLFSTLFSFAIEQYVIRNYYHEEPQELINKAISLSMIVSTGIILISVLFFNEISTFIFNDNNNVIGFVILILCSIFNMIFKYTSLILRMERESFFFSITQIFQRAIILLLSLGVIYFIDKDDRSWLDIISIHTFSIFFIVIFQIFLVNTSTKIDFFKFTIINRLDFKKIFYYSYPLLFSVLILWGMSSIDKVAIKMYLSSYDLGIYSNAYKFAAALILFQQMISVIWVPTSMRWYKKNMPLNKYKSIFSFIVGITLFVYTLCIILLPYLKLLINDDFYASIKLIPIIMIYPAFYIFSEFTNMGILFKEKTNYSIHISIITIVVCVFLSIYLTKNYSVLGTAIAIAISYMVFFITRTYYSIKVWNNILSLTSVFGIIILILVCISYYYDFYLNIIVFISFLYSIYLALYNFRILKQ